MATAARHLAYAMTDHRQPASAAEFAMAAASLTPDPLGVGPEGLSTLGMLYLKAAMAQATAADVNDSRRAAAAARAVPDLMDQAEEHAEQLLRDDTDGNTLWSAFGLSNVALYRLAARVQLADDAGGMAVTLSLSAPAFARRVRRLGRHRPSPGRTATPLPNGGPHLGFRPGPPDDAGRPHPHRTPGNPRPPDDRHARHRPD
ncbi:hypothetical protein AB5J72_49035 [Streptomyces sp. CG1]|uniref:hypothetical protein n=1 Tax=Streptomyces sp. CG1 TaxID=1287523 RepID=UPI0034E206B8